MFTQHKILKSIKEESKVIHKIWLEEDKEDKKVDIEFYCPETPEENEKFNNKIDDMLERIRLMNYFRGIQ